MDVRWSILCLLQDASLLQRSVTKLLAKHFQHCCAIGDTAKAIGLATKKVPGALEAGRRASSDNLLEDIGAAS
jgi:hypothetical protein